MTPETLKQLEEILSHHDIWKRINMIRAWKETVPVVEETKGARTSAQNSAMHLWFTQIADICQNQGVTMNLIIGHTHDVIVTKDGVKGLWKALQEALFSTKSTTELKKTGEIDQMIDHMVVLFAKEEVEIPPFPSSEPLTNTKLAQVDNLSRQDYPTFDESTSSNKF